MASLREVKAESLVAAEEKQPEQRVAQAQALALLLAALKVVSQRAFTALVNSVTLLGLAAVAALAWKISAEPSNAQLAELAIFGAFVLALRFVWRK